MSNRLTCPHCGEPTFRRSQVIGYYAPIACSLCGKRAGPTIRSALWSILATGGIAGLSVIPFFLLARPTESLSKVQLLQQPEFWIVAPLGVMLVAWAQARIVRLRRW